MANCSFAHGEITISAENEQKVNLIVEAINKEFGGCEYFTEIFTPGVRTRDQSDEALDYKCNFPVTFVYDFEGCGRWTYSNNVENFGRWVHDNQTLKELAWRISFDYSDFEPGCEVLYTAISVIEHERNQPLEEIRVLSSYESDYDVSKENMNILGFDDDLWQFMYEEEE